MRAVIQRVTNASLSTKGKQISRIEKGLIVYLGIGNDDTEADKEWLINKIVNMRIFSDEHGKINLSVLDIKGEILVVSQFTLYASTKKGNRPSFLRSAKPSQAIPMYEDFLMQLKKIVPTQSGIFGADMQITSTNDGPITITIDTKQKE